MRYQPARLSRLLLLLVCFTCCIRSSGQSYPQQFDALFLKEHPDSVQIKTLLRLWQRMNADDPQLYVSAYNFYFAQSGKESIVVQGAPESAVNPGGAAASIGSYTEYDSQKVRIANGWIDEGIRRFPDRLDMWFGKAHVLRLTHSFDSFQVLMERVLDRSVENHNAWYWTEGTKLDSGRRFMLNTMQSYLRELYETEREDLLPVMSKLGAAIVRVYPEEVEILSTTAVSLILQKQYAQAIIYLKRAEKVRPRDVIVLSNLAEAYRLQGDKRTARYYLQLVETHGSPQEKETARREMKTLKR